MSDFYPIEEKSTPVKFKTIREWRPDERPRERLSKNGASTLSDSELLAILIGTGTAKKNAVDVARALLDKYGDISRVSSCDISELTQISGIGYAKAVKLAAAFELNKRISFDSFESKKRFSSPNDIAEYFIPRLRDARKEMFFVLLLNTSNQIFREIKVSEGILDATVVHPREVFRLAITEGASSVVVLHNHPSGNPSASEEDKNITKQIYKAGKIIGIKLLDHIIIAGDKFTSLAREGELE